MITQKKNYVNDVGTEILVDTGSDLSTATELALYVRKPSGKAVTWAGTLGPINPQGVKVYIKYIVETGDWDEPGWWSLQSYVKITAWEGRGETVKFQLFPEFK